MNTIQLEKLLINIAKEKITTIDPSHDYFHSLRVLANAEQIAENEKADLEIVIPAALFHDIITYPKNDPRSKTAQHESALLAAEILMNISEFPQNKIEKVMNAIELCSFSKGITPNDLEAQILQDADGLEATGAISIMRTFCSTGQMNRPFYNADDPFCESREPADMEYAIDLFFTRLIKVSERMHTNYAMKIAENRTKFLRNFLEELRLELEGK